jgi:hypothetical protein
LNLIIMGWNRGKWVQFQNNVMELYSSIIILPIVVQFQYHLRSINMNRLFKLICR